MPRKPATIIQKIAPGPPMATATATPAMLPSPTVADRAEEQRLKVGDLARVVGIIVVAGRHHPGVPKRADVDEAEPKREEDGAGDEPKDDEWEPQIVLAAVVPKDEVEKENLRHRADDVGPEPTIDRFEHAADGGRLGCLGLGERDARPQTHP